MVIFCNLITKIEQELKTKKKTEMKGGHVPLSLQKSHLQT